MATASCLLCYEILCKHLSVWLMLFPSQKVAIDSLREILCQDPFRLFQVRRSLFLGESLFFLAF